MKSKHCLCAVQFGFAASFQFIVKAWIHFRETSQSSTIPIVTSTRTSGDASTCENCFIELVYFIFVNIVAFVCWLVCCLCWCWGWGWRACVGAKEIAILDWTSNGISFCIKSSVEHQMGWVFLSHRQFGVQRAILLATHALLHKVITCEKSSTDIWYPTHGADETGHRFYIAEQAEMQNGVSFLSHCQFGVQRAVLNWLPMHFSFATFLSSKTLCIFRGFNPRARPDTFWLIFFLCFLSRFSKFWSILDPFYIYEATKIQS